MLEKIKKFARIPRIKERNNKPHILPETPERERIDSLWKKAMGKRIIAVITAVMNTRVKGEVSFNTLWSRVYTSPHVRAAATA